MKEECETVKENSVWQQERLEWYQAQAVQSMLMQKNGGVWCGIVSCFDFLSLLSQSQVYFNWKLHLTIEWETFWKKKLLI